MPAKHSQSRRALAIAGLPVTIVGTVDSPAIAVAAYGTPFELALAVISSAAAEGGAAESHRLAGHEGAARMLGEAAQIAAARQEAKDRMRT